MKRQRINFIPQDLRPHFKIPREILPLGLVIVVLLYCGGSALRYSVVLGMKQSQLKEITATSAVLTLKVQELTERNNQLDKNDKAVSAIQKVVGRKNYWSEIFKELSILIPDGIWLTNFNDQKAKTPKDDTRLSLRGEADSDQVVAKFLTVLEKSHHFGGVQMDYLEKQANVQPVRYKFKFTVPVKVLTSGGGS